MHKNNIARKIFIKINVKHAHLYFYSFKKGGKFDTFVPENSDESTCV